MVLKLSRKKQCQRDSFLGINIGALTYVLTMFNVGVMQYQPDVLVMERIMHAVHMRVCNYLALVQEHVHAMCCSVNKVGSSNES